MANKIKYGLKNVHIAIQTESEGAYTYDSPVPLPGAVSLSLEPSGEENAFYADDIVYYRTPGNNGYSGDLEVALVNEWFRINVLGEKKDTNGVLAEVADGAEAPKFAMLFEFQGDEKGIRHVMYNCSCSRPSVGSSTKEDAATPQTESLTITNTPRSDGLVKAKTGDDATTAVYTGWYESVYTPVLTDAGN